MVKLKESRATTKIQGVEKCPTGIRGLDEITMGGLPRARPTLICGGAGSGKTLMAMEFIVRGIRDYGEPGVFMAFEETEQDLTKNVASLGFDLEELIRQKKLALDHVRVERSEIEETGEYDLEGLFVRLNSMIEEVGAERVATGVERLDAMMGGKGYYRGSSILVSGTAGTGKTSVAVAFADAACRRRELEQEQAHARAELKALQLKTASLNDELQTLEKEEEARLTAVSRERMELARVRGVDSGKDTTKKGSNTHANRGR